MTETEGLSDAAAGYLRAWAKYENAQRTTCPVCHFESSDGYATSHAPGCTAPPFKRWDCGCTSDNATLTPCPEHVGPVATARNLRATDPRLNVVFAPTPMTLVFLDAQGNTGKFTTLLSRDSLRKVMALMGDLDEAAEA